MSIAGSQKRTLLLLLAILQPHWHRDPALPARIQALLTKHRRFGSRDRRLYRELIYTTLRHLPWVEPLLASAPDEAVRRVAWFAADTPATKAFRAALATGAPPSGDKAELLPGWFRAHCPEVFSEPELDVQLLRPPVWLRLQGPEPQRVLSEFDERGWSWRRPEILPDALELRTEADVTKTDAWRKGWIEVQDLGSQLILESVGIEAGGRWLDACAGAGGKTLQIARIIGPEATVDAFDVRAAALDELVRRVERAGGRCHSLDDNAAVPRSEGERSPPATGNATAAVRVLRTPPVEMYDGVLVDAPCSGSGTWRRAPHLKWVTSEAHIEQAAATQRALLDQFSARVKPGGRLIYATCSLSSRENEEVVAAFLATHANFRPEAFGNTFRAKPRGPGILILPSTHDSDGFFVASLRCT